MEGREGDMEDGVEIMKGGDVMTEGARWREWKEFMQ
jgi:hypothetical protein